MLKRVHHVGIVVPDLAAAIALWRDVLGLRLTREARLEDQGVHAALLETRGSEIELLEPLSATNGVGRFLERFGGGLHHICFESDDVAADLAAARKRGLELIDKHPRPGLAGMICFLHPKAAHGVLVEFAQPVTETQN
jgi:methylmalonyl-CoA epimerase